MSRKRKYFVEMHSIVIDGKKYPITKVQAIKLKTSFREFFDFVKKIMSANERT